ncbi:hypothetical protein DNTS_009429, partial [Danionella cerebrum]
ALQLSIRGSNGVGSGYSSDQLLIRSIDLVNQTLSITLLFHRRNSELMLKRFNHGSVRALQPQRARARAVKPVNVPVLRHGALFNIRDESEGAARSSGRVPAQPLRLLVQLHALLLRWSRALRSDDGRRPGCPALQHHQPDAGLAHVVPGVLLPSGCRLLAGLHLASASRADRHEGSDAYVEGGGRSHRGRKELVRGVWKPETNELLKMSYPTKVTLLGAVAFSLQQCRWIPVETPQLMLLYTLFLVTNKRSKPEPELSRWPNGAQDSDGGGSLQEKLVSAGTASDGPAQRRVPARTRSARAKDSPALSAEFVS